MDKKAHLQGRLQRDPAVEHVSALQDSKQPRRRAAALCEVCIVRRRLREGRARCDNRTQDAPYSSSSPHLQSWPGVSVCTLCYSMQQRLHVVLEQTAFLGAHTHMRDLSFARSTHAWNACNSTSGTTDAWCDGQPQDGFKGVRTEQTRSLSGEDRGGSVLLSAEWSRVHAGGRVHAGR